MQSRYYDPTIGRFINADALVSTGQGLLGYNMFAYCKNNPVNMSDFTGNLPKWLSDATDWVNKKIISPTTTWMKKAYRAISTEGFVQKACDIIVDNTTASAGVSLGIGLQSAISDVFGIEATERIDIIGVQFRNGEFSIGCPGKSAFAVGIGPITIGPQSEVFESFGGEDRIEYDDVYFDIGYSMGNSSVFFLGYHYDFSISYLGIFKDMMKYINTF